MSTTLQMLPDCAIPQDFSRQVTADVMAERLAERVDGLKQILDVGCGEGGSLDLFRRILPHATWMGVDIVDSREAQKRRRTDGNFCSFDGVHLPFADASLDLLFCRQVFEHVRHPELLLGEMHRVLVKGGHLVLSASYLETYHSRSLWGYTPYGFHELLKAAEFDLLEMRPGIDGLTLLVRRLAGRPRFSDRWFTVESPLNRLIHLYGRLAGKSHRWINERKLLFCGHFCLLAQKPAQPPTKDEEATASA